MIEALTSLSKYVGTVYPGKNSLISEINIAITQKKISRNILITSDSSLETKGYPVIENKLVYKNFKIDFKSLIRPELKIKLNKPKKRILREVQSLKKNIIIVGASSGIGNDLLNLFINNKKVKIIATYFKNKILIKKPNLIIKKINIENDLLYILKIIKKYSPCLIYYFPTPKILFKIVKDKKIIKSYKNYFIKWPIQIIKHSSKYNCGFFYPSTTYSNNLSIYSLVKSKAEKEINKLRSNKVKISIAKIPGINTKQNLSLINKKLPTFRELISRDDKIFKQVFFK